MRSKTSMNINEMHTYNSRKRAESGSRRTSQLRVVTRNARAAVCSCRFPRPLQRVTAGPKLFLVRRHFLGSRVVIKERTKPVIRNVGAIGFETGPPAPEADSRKLNCWEIASLLCFEPSNLVPL